MTAQQAPDLLAVARNVLRQNNFDVRAEALSGAATGWLLAESELFIVAVAAARNLEELRTVEAFAAPELLGRLSSAQDIGGKRWDAYLVLISSLGSEGAGDARQLVDMEYDTRGVRRLVAVAVQPTDEDLRRVLRPFIALPAPPAAGIADAFADLQEQLIVNGVQEDEARRVVTTFSERGHLDDV